MRRGARPTKPLNQRYRARKGCLFRITYLLHQMQGDDAVNDIQHLTGNRWTTCQLKKQLEWEAEYPPTRWFVRQDLIYYQGSALPSFANCCLKAG